MSGVDTGPFGFGPFAGGLTDCSPHPPGLGYGSLADPLSSATYGFSPYGGGVFPGVPYPVSGGYGGSPYGHGPYGASPDVDAPGLTGALSLDGFRIEVFFSETVKLDPDFFDVSNYILTSVLGAAPLTVTSIGVGTSVSGGANSAILFTTGTTLGGRYALTVINVRDASDNLIQDSGANSTELLAKGSVPAMVVTPLDGSTILVDFDQGILTESEFSPGVVDIASYTLTTEYPVEPILQSVEHPHLGDTSQVALELQGMTSAEYLLEVGPALAFSYIPTSLPDADPGFNGSEVGTGTSITVGTTLRLTKSAGDIYGWNFAEDPNVKILPNSSYRIDTSFNLSGTIFTPALFDSSAFVSHVSDGLIQATLVFTKVAGVDTIRMVSGNYSEEAPAEWSSGPVTVSLVRNQKAETYTLVFNDTPLITAPFTGIVGEFPDGPALTPAGTQLLLTATYDVQNFSISNLQFTSSQTVFTEAWNFIHTEETSFTGSADFALDRILTEHGPLVKNWGDHTPAKIEDVAVRVNGTDVEVAEVNPYTGEIRTTIPIPRMSAGLLDVDVDYTWFPNPTFPMTGLNTPGLILNKWNAPRGRTAETTGTPTGAYDSSRFPYSVVLGPEDPCEPLWVGHRYIGFEKAYTAALNSPGTLLLNQVPWGASKPYARAGSTEESINLELGGLSDEWEIRGNGTASPTETSYTLTDDSTESPTFVARSVDLSVDSTVLAATRFHTTSFDLDGIFSGISFGFHNNDRLYLVGALVVNGLEHVGILLNTMDPTVVSSWLIGPQSTGEIVASNRVEFPVGSVPSSLESGERFQVLKGLQAGVYTVTQAFFDTDKTTIEIQETFPANYATWGNRDVEVLFENIWSTSAVTWRIEADTETQTFTLVFGGDPSGVLTLGGQMLPEPGTFALDTSGSGELIWGSFSRSATSITDWSLLRWESGPKPGTTFSRGTIENVGFFDFIEEGWFPTSPYGYSEVDNNGELFLRGIAASTSRDTSFGYSRLDPFLSTDFLTVLQSRFKVDSWTSGGDGSIRILDSKRTAQLSTLAFRDSGSKSLIELPFASLSSVASLSDQGWTLTGELDTELEAPFVDVIKGASQAGTLARTISGGTESATGDKVLSARLAVQSWTADTTGRIGLQVAADAFADTGLEWYAATTTDPAQLFLVSGTVPVAGFDFNWEDGEQHTYEVQTDSSSGLATLTVDGAVLGTAPLASFSTLNVTGTQARLIGSGSGVGYEIRLREFSVTIREPSDTLRTLGVWLGGDFSDINNWAIPRSDPGIVDNSDPGSSIYEMDWSEEIEVRMHLDPTFGLVIERPDVALPPGYVADDFATRDTNPSRGWIVVEYRHLPFNPVSFGSVGFGPLNPESLSNQNWYSLYYRIYTDPVDDYVAPHHMVLNQYNVITSGEHGLDREPEVVVVNSLTATLISVRSSAQNASRVYNVMVDGLLLDPNSWEFDEESQTILLDSPLPTDHYPITITFAPGKPVTCAYLDRQPFSQSVTKLNEGTPPYPKSQLAEIVRRIISGSSLNDINDILNSDPDLILNDPFQTVTFDNDPETLYEDLKFITVPNGGKTGLISSICDGPAPGAGFVAMEIADPLVFQDNARFMGCTGDPFEGGGVMLHASGGSPNVIGLLNAPTILMPVTHSTSGSVSEGEGRCVPRVTWDIHLGSVLDGASEILLEDTFGDFSDGYAPTGPPELEVNPPSAEFPGGAAWYRLEDSALPSGIFPILGPSTGMEDLEEDSLLYGASVEQPQGTPDSGQGLQLYDGITVPLGGIISEGILS